MKQIRRLPTILFLVWVGGSGLVACKHLTPSVAASLDGLPLRSDLYTPVTFVQHEEASPQATYLAQNIYVPAVDALKLEVESKYGVKLKSRGESHITVVTPGEYSTILKRRLSMARIGQIARESGIQQIPFEIVCLGLAAKELDHHLASTYFIVVESPGLIDLRRKIRAAYVDAGGSAKDFAAEFYQPHVTVGYTDRDLHIEDGVNKDKGSCVNALTLAAP